MRLRDAAATLASYTKSQMVRALGLPSIHNSRVAITKDNTRRLDLHPFCAIDYPGRVAMNVATVVEAMKWNDELLVPVVLVFDETYLCKKFDIVKLEGSNVVVGGTWPSATLTQDEVKTTRGSLPEEHLAPFMMDFMVKRGDYHKTVSVCSLPLAKKGQKAEMVMEIVSRVLEPILADHRVGSLFMSCDNAVNFQMLNKALLGCPIPAASLEPS